MNLKTFNALVGQESYVRCQGKERLDPAIVDTTSAEHHLFSGGTIGWWVRQGYIVVDIDEGKDIAKKLIKKLKLNTLIAETPKGIHLYFKTDRDFPQKIGMIMPFGLKADFRCANKGYVLLPFGLADRKFNRATEIADLPLEWTPIPNRKDSLLNLKEGDGRNATLFAHLMAYKNRGATQEQVDVMAHIVNDDVFSQPMAPSELDKIIANVEKYEAKVGGDNPYLIYNNKGYAGQVNARAISDYFVNRGDIFTIGGECYQYRDGMYQEASSYVRNTIRDMIVEDHLITHSRIMEVYRLLIDDTRLHRDASELNKDKNLINFKNGVWDIHRKLLMPHDSKYLLTLQLPHEYVPPTQEFEDTRLYKFLTEQVKLPEDDMNMVLDYMAYTLTLDYGLKTFMIFNGQSNTGKSVLIRFFEALVGVQNTSALSMQELSMRFYPSQLYNRLLNSCADNSSLPLSSIENLKKITGGDQIMHEKKGKEPFFFVPYAKLLFSFNQLPLQLEEKSNAFYKRMRILSMSKELFLNNEYVNDLCSNDSVEEALPHLLARLPLKAIPTTPTSDDLVESLRQDSDSIHAFLTQKCVVGKNKYVPKKSIYDIYMNFCIETGRTPHKKLTFARHLRSQGFKESRHPTSREAVWRGFGMRRKL